MANADRCIDAVDYLNGREVGENVVIIGGGLTGCEIAYDLFLKGKKPVIVEAKQDLMAVRGLCLANSSYLRDYFKAYKVPVYLNSSVSEILDKKVVVSNAEGSKKINADDIILAIGYNPNPIVAKGKNIHVVGDAYSVGNLRTVVWRAWEVAEQI